MEDLLIIPYLINLIVLALVHYKHKEYIPSLLKSAVSYNYSYKLIRETKSYKAAGNFYLSIIFYLSTSIFISYLIIRYVPEAKNAKLLVLASYSFAGIFIVNIFYKTVNYLSGKIFRLDDVRKEYNQNINIFNQFLGLGLFPICVFISYSSVENVAFLIGIVVFIISYLLRIVRLIKINFVKGIHIFYMFLYLCTFEIIPILYLIKTLTAL